MSYSHIHPTGARPEAIGGRDVQAVPWTAGRRRAGMHSTLHDAGGTAAGYFYYPWAYPTPSGHYAFIVLTIVEAIGYLFSVKVSEEGSTKKSNGIIAATLAGTAVGTVLISLFVGN